MNLKQALKRIEELEERVRKLEAEKPFVAYPPMFQFVGPTTPSVGVSWCGGAGQH